MSENQSDAPQTIEELSLAYSLKGLKTLFNAQAQGVDVVNLYGLDIDDLGWKNVSCTLRFTYDDGFYLHDGLQGEEPIEGFHLELIDMQTEDQLVRVFHGMSNPENGRFDITAGNLTIDYESQKEATMLQAMVSSAPANLLKAICAAVPENTMFDDLNNPPKLH